MEQVIAYVFGALASIGAIGALISKAQYASKYLSLASKVVVFIDCLIKSAADSKLSEEEIKKIASEAKEIKEAYQLIKKK